MLEDFLHTHRTTLIARCRAKVARRPVPTPTPAELEHGIPMFLDQLITALRQQSRPGAAPRGMRLVSKATLENAAEIGTTASAHGKELMKQGFTIDQVVHDYGDLCQAVTELAAETLTPIGVDEFRTLNQCLDDAIASAVKEFSLRHDSAIAARTLSVSDERARTLLNDMSTHINAAELAIEAIKTGRLGLKGATGALLDLSLVSMRKLIERSLPEEKPGTGSRAKH